MFYLNFSQSNGRNIRYKLLSLLTGDLEEIGGLGKLGFQYSLEEEKTTTTKQQHKYTERMD